MAKKTTANATATPKLAEPLTPAQVAAVQQLIADRHAELLAAVNDLVAAATAEAVSYGDQVALRMNSGLLVGVNLGGPTEPEQTIGCISKDGVGPWESFAVERGHG